MSWRAITESDVLTQISGAELEALRGAVLADGQADPVQPCSDAVTAKVRGFVAANASNALDADASKIPDRLIDGAVSLIIIQIMTRAGGTLIDPEGARQKAADEANRLLRDVAAGKFSIADPVSGNEGSSAVTPVYIPSRTRLRFDRESQEGL
jgi:hypothetical protein